MTAITGIEITAVHRGRDVHMLGYFVDVSNTALTAFLQAQRDDRRRRVRAMVDRLREIGVPVDGARLVDETGDTGQSIGRPYLAAALVAAGHVADMDEAFTRYLGEGRPAFVARSGPEPAEVVGRIHEAGGLASLAHPGTTRVDPLVPLLADEGLDAIEVFHPDHSASDVARYGELARRLGLAVTGGSDYHGPASGRAPSLGRVTLPVRDFEALVERAHRSRP
jgi:predicted metal-dependent phosphoesterase TrpH